MKNKFPLVSLGEVISHRKEFIKIDDATVYKRCRVKLHTKGIILRDEVEGARIKTKKQQVCRSNEFLVAEIDAKVGGFGMVPPELEGAIVSSHYFLFSVLETKLDYRFLGYFVRTPFFRDQVKARGSTNYAAIRPNQVLDYKIPLPPLGEQLRIVAKIDRLAAKIKEARGLREQARQGVTASIKASRRSAIGVKPAPDWIELQDVIVNIQNGWSPQCKAYPATKGKWGVIKVGAVSFGKFDPNENKELPMALEPKNKYEIMPGDFLMSRANTLELVGACALVCNTPRKLLLCDKVFRFAFNKNSKIDPEYLNQVLKSPALRAQIESTDTGATGTSPTMKNISKAKIMRLKIPCPSLSVQRRIVSRLNGLLIGIEKIKSLQQESDNELNALLPSILDRAFRGELLEKSIIGNDASKLAGRVAFYAVLLLRQWGRPAERNVFDAGLALMLNDTAREKILGSGDLSGRQASQESKTPFRGLDALLGEMCACRAISITNRKGKQLVALGSKAPSTATIPTKDKERLKETLAALKSVSEDRVTDVLAQMTETTYELAST